MARQRMALLAMRTRTMNRKQQARKALRYHRYLQALPATWVLNPPTVTIAVAHRLYPHVYPLINRRKWRTER